MQNRTVYILSTAALPVERASRLTLRELGTAVLREAMETSGLDRLDTLYASNMLSDELQGQKHIAALIATEMGWLGAEALAVRAATASGAAALRVAWLALQSGETDTVAVVGMEKMSQADPTSALARALDAEKEIPAGETMISINARVMDLYMKKHRVRYDDFANFAVNAHRNAAGNPGALFKKEVTAEAVKTAREIVPPIRLFDCAPICDGAAAVILTTNPDLVPKPAIRVAASAVAVDFMEVARREHAMELTASRLSAEKAYRLANLSATDIDFFELHDAFSIMSCLALEACGFAEEGEGVRLAMDGKIFREGSLPIATMGGLKARGHPIGATALYQVHEIVQQMQGRAGANQLERTQRAMTQSIGGAGTTLITHIIEREDS